MILITNKKKNKTLISIDINIITIKVILYLLLKYI